MKYSPPREDDRAQTYRARDEGRGNSDSYTAMLENKVGHMENQIRELEEMVKVKELDQREKEI